MASTLSALGSIYLLVALTVLSHTLLLGIAMIIGATVAGVLLLATGPDRAPAVPTGERLSLPAQRETPERELASSR